MTRARALALVVAVAGAAAACSSAPQKVIMPEKKPALQIQIGHYDPSATVPIVSDDVAMPVEGHTAPATIAHPTTGVWPGVVLLAGAGPTDRNWNNPNIATGANPSGKQLAEYLASHGAVVIRFDQAGAGGNTLKPEQITMDTYVDEAREALTVLRSRPNVDGHHLFVIGHDLGGLHALRVGIAEGGRIAGVALLAPPGRTQRDITLAQLDARLAAEVHAGKLTADAAKGERAMIAGGLNDFIEGRDVAPDAKTNELKNLADPKTGKLARDELAFDPADAIVKLNVPVLIMIGLKDIETDPTLDGGRLQDKAKTAGVDVQLFLAPDANHVMKHEVKPAAALRADLASVQAAYAAPNIALDDAAAASVGNWIAAHDTKE